MEEIVWGKLKGFPWWPGFINGKNQDKYELVFLGDFTRAILKSNKIQSYNSNSVGKVYKNRSLIEAVEVADKLINNKINLKDIIE